MLDVHSGGDELRAGLRHRSQESFPALVNERDITKVDNAGSSTPVAARLFPACPQLTDPRPDQPAVQNPSLFRRCLIDGDPQHVYLFLPN
jgi:hypothetical protein